MAGKGGPYKVFVGGLSQEVTTEILSDYFSTFGTLTDSVVMTDRGTGRSRGFGFVSFDTPDPVDQIMAMHKEHTIMGKWIDCKNATPEGTKGAMGGKGDYGGGGCGGCGGCGGPIKGGGKPGDWKCPNCGAMCFGSKDVCFKCGTPKSSGYGGGGGGGYGGYSAVPPPTSYGGGGCGGGAYGGGAYGGGGYGGYGSCGGWGMKGGYGGYGKDGKGCSPY
ncbi:unnamed protein product [Durusdinium trenchii]|uniref:Uncharacterized protein n=2 Tax=Durusdinium trenchii TaxID=1381693 RepID=A0ABP0QGF2_9DINO